MNSAIARTLSDAELVAEVKRLAGCEREAKVRLIIHLAELDTRRLFLGAGFCSLFEYCTEVLRLSEHETYNRIEAARALRRCPAILDMLVEGSLTLTTVRLLAPHLMPENQEQLLAAARGKSKRQVEEVIAGLFPRPELPALIRKLPQPRAAAVPVIAGAMCGGEPQRVAPAADAAVGGTEPARGGSAAPGAEPVSAATVPPGPVTPTRAATTPQRPTATAVAAERYQIRFTAGAATYEKLRRAQDLLRHVIPDGDPGKIVDRALILLLDDLARKKFAATDRPRSGRGTAPRSRYIPAPVRRKVWIRDGGRCAFVSKDGRRCSARSLLEFHHKHPYAEGGEATVENIELRCRAHNVYEADLYFGPMLEDSSVVREAAGGYVAAGRSGTSRTAGRASVRLDFAGSHGGGCGTRQANEVGNCRDLGADRPRHPGHPHRHLGQVGSATPRNSDHQRRRHPLEVVQEAVVQAALLGSAG